MSILKTFFGVGYTYSGIFLVIFTEVMVLVALSFITLAIGVNIKNFFGIIYTSSGIFPVIMTEVMLIAA